MTYSAHSLQGKAYRESQLRAQGYAPQARPGRSRWFMGAASVMALAAITASAQVATSPFASKTKKPAWENAPLASTAPSSPAQFEPGKYKEPQYRAPEYDAPARFDPNNYSEPQYVAPTYEAPKYSGPQATGQDTPALYRAPDVTPPAAKQPYYFPKPSADVPPLLAPTGRAPLPVAPPASQFETPNRSGDQARLPQGYNGMGYDGGAYYGDSYGASAPPAYGTYQPRRAAGLSFQAPAPQDGTHYPGRPKTLTSQGADYAQYKPSATPPLDPKYQQSTGQAPQGQYQPYPPQNYPPQNYNAPPSRPVMAKASWKDRLGLSNLATTISGFLKLGAGATDDDSARGDGWREDFIGDGMVRGEVSAITLGGLEYGVGAELRGQYDRYRRGFGGLVGDCPPGVVGCSSTVVASLDTAVRGHTSQFYTNGLDNSEDITAALEGAYIFLRSAYGDITVGRDDGAAFLFSLGAPSLVAVNASNSPVDYTGLDSVKTVNDASGFAEKVTYVSPRLLGDQIGVGIQFGASYAPDAKACGVDYCVKRNGDNGSNTLAPDLEDIVELGLSLDRTFASGLSVEATASYAMGSERSGLAPLDDLQAFGAGLEFALKSWRLGGSYLQSNNALQDGDYTAYDIGLSYKPGRWGASLSYGHATDDNIDLSSDQATLGFVYDLNQKITLGTGVQYARRRVPVVTSVNGLDVLARDSESAASVFVEAGITF